jgi:hypothetical protein
VTKIEKNEPQWIFGHKKTVGKRHFSFDNYANSAYVMDTVTPRFYPIFFGSLAEFLNELFVFTSPFEIAFKEHFIDQVP